MYLLLLLVGALGFLAMTLLGLGHGIGGGHHGAIGSHAPSGHGHGHVPLPTHGHAPPAHQGGGRHVGHVNHASVSHSDGERPFASKVLMFVSPLDVFSLALGAGATGILVAPFVPAQWLAGCSVVGALAFDFALVKPLIGLMARFVSRPSDGLEGEVSKAAEAVTAFDHNGRGVVKLNLDGQIVQLLANLDANERESGIPVAKGDKVLVIEVDPGRNSCRVSRELASQLADDAAYTSSQAQK